MAILHGNWVAPTHTQSRRSASPEGQGSPPLADPGGYLFIWGETWRRVVPEAISLGKEAVMNPDDASSPRPNVLPLPFAMTPMELGNFLKSRDPFPGSPGGFLPEGIFTSSDRRRQPKQSRRNQQEEIPASSTSPSRYWRSQTLFLPTAVLEQSELQFTATPQYSRIVLDGGEPRPGPTLYPWQVWGICLSPQEAVRFLSSLPLGIATAEDTWLGDDLRFWAHLTRWTLDLLARSKFLPTLERHADTTWLAWWQPLLDSDTDQTRLGHFIQAMPGVCRSYRQPVPGVQQVKPGSQFNAVDIPTDPKDLILAFLASTIDTQVRHSAPKQPLPVKLPTAPNRAGRNAEPETTVLAWQWLQALSTEEPTPQQAPSELIERFEASLAAWMVPVAHCLSGEQSQFRICFHLTPPTSDRSDWRLEYLLQATDDAEFLIDAATIWAHPVEALVHRGRTIKHPQETFLQGLGLASKFLPELESSLQEQSPSYCSLSLEQAYKFLKISVWRLQDSGFGVILPPGLADHESRSSRPGLKIQAITPARKASQQLGLQSLLNFRWELIIGDQTLSKQDFDRLASLNTPLVEINGEWVELRPQDVRTVQEFFASRQDKTNLSLEDVLRMSTGNTQTLGKLPVVSFEASGALQELVTTLTGDRSITPIPAPTRFRGQLRPYQERGVGWLAFLERWGLGACLADDMGLGKTIQTIAFLLHLQEQERLERPVLLVCPTSVLSNWRREVDKFAPTLKVAVHHGEKRPKGKALVKAAQGQDMVVTSYALVHRDGKALQSVNWQGIILDEAQNIKNPEARQSQVIRQLQATFNIALTGTPVENRLSELWSIMDFLNPGYLGPRNFFQRRFAIPIERYGDTASLQTLRSLVRPFILRRLKTDRSIIQDLPEKQEITVFCSLSPEQAQLYQQVTNQALATIEAAEGIQRRGLILALLTKLKQICNHPAQFQKEKRLGPELRSGKLRRLREMLEEVLAEGDGYGGVGRALIFTQFAEWGKLLKVYLEEQLQCETLFLYGGVRKKQREELIDRFQFDPQGPPIFILSLKAGGVGLNLTRANHVFHFDRWWNPAVENQATDRAFRIGQTRNIQVHKFVCSGTVEEKIHEMIEGKKALAEQVVGAGEAWLTELDTDQLRNLLLLDRSAVIDDEDT